MKRHAATLLALAALSTTATAAAPPPPAKYTGTLEGELVLARGEGYVAGQLPLAPKATVAALPAEPPVGSRVFAGPLGWAGGEVEIVWVEPPNAKPFVYADRNADGKITGDERYEFRDTPGDPVVLGEIILSLPLPPGRYHGYPVRIVLPNPERMPTGYAESRTLWHQNEAVARGTVDVEGRKVLVQYSIDAKTGRIDPTNAALGVDTNGDGQIDGGSLSYESAFSRGATVVFRAGDRYVSTDSVDTTTGEIVMRDRHASDYVRVELREGAELPDFAFADLDGKPHRLSEYRGKYVLVDFWATWCGPCVGEIPHLKAAYATYRARGFEIVGVSGDESADKVRPFARERGVAWTLATPESTKNFVATRVRISSWPTTILVGPDGNIVSLGRTLPLRGDALAKTLEGLLPPPAK